MNDMRKLIESVEALYEEEDSKTPRRDLLNHIVVLAENGDVETLEYVLRQLLQTVPVANVLEILKTFRG